MTQIEKVQYTAQTHATGGRVDGVSRSSDGRLDIRISTPGTAGSGNNQQPFAAGWSAYFEGAMGARWPQNDDRLPGCPGNRHNRRRLLPPKSPQRESAGCGGRSRPSPGGRRAPDVSLLQNQTWQR
jgi:hypothetical protein